MKLVKKMDLNKINCQKKVGNIEGKCNLLTLHHFIENQKMGWKQIVYSIIPAKNKRCHHKKAPKTAEMIPQTFNQRNSKF